MFVPERAEVKSEAEAEVAPEITGVDPAGFSDDELDREMHSLWAHIHVAMGRAVALQGR